MTGGRAGDVLEQGQASGRPLGSGSVSLSAHLAASGALVHFTIVNGHGSISGVARVRLVFTRGRIGYVGVADVTQGTGEYRRVRASGLQVTGSGDSGGTRTVLRIAGRVRD